MAAKAAAEALGRMSSSPHGSLSESPEGDTLQMRLLPEEPVTEGGGKWPKKNNGENVWDSDGRAEVYEDEDGGGIAVPEDKGGMSWQDASVMVRDSQRSLMPL